MASEVISHLNTPVLKTVVQWLFDHPMTSSQNGKVSI